MDRVDLLIKVQQLADELGEVVGWLHYLAADDVVTMDEYRRVKVLTQNARILFDQAVWELTKK